MFIKSFMVNFLLFLWLLKYRLFITSKIVSSQKTFFLKEMGQILFLHPVVYLIKLKATSKCRAKIEKTSMEVAWWLASHDKY